MLQVKRIFFNHVILFWWVFLNTRVRILYHEEEILTAELIQRRGALCLF